MKSSIDFNKNNFPWTSTVAGLMQAAYAFLENITRVVGSYVIVWGCVDSGSYVSEGIVVVNGELMEFEGGSPQTYVKVQETTETITVGDGDYTKTTRTLVFGVGSGQIAWSLFKTIDTISELTNGKVDKVSGKELSSNDFTTAYKDKLDNIEDDANNYSHPASHSIAEVDGLQAELDKIKILRVGDFGPFNVSGSDLIDDAVTVTFLDVGTTDYVVMGSYFESSPEDQGDNNMGTWVVTEKGTNYFKVFFAETQPEVQSMMFEFVIVAK